jgi:hypothetical protein
MEGIKSEVVMVQRPSHIVLSLGYDEAVVLMTALKWHHTAISRWFDDGMKQTVEDVLRLTGAALDVSLQQFRDRK